MANYFHPENYKKIYESIEKSALNCGLYFIGKFEFLWTLLEIFSRLRTFFITYQQNDIRSSSAKDISDKSGKIGSSYSECSGKNLNCLNPHNKPTNITKSFGCNGQTCDYRSFNFKLEQNHNYSISDTCQNLKADLTPSTPNSSDKKLSHKN